MTFFPQPGFPHYPFDKLKDAAQVHGRTEICSSVSVCIPQIRPRATQSWRTGPRPAGYLASLGSEDL